jgi:uncharacterized protein YozE (UPF0346 family)
MDMTFFWRNGHWRNSVKGNSHYVNGHNVSRTSFEIESSYKYNSNKEDNILSILNYAPTEKLFWIDIQIKKTNINFQNLNHLVKYKGSYRKAVTYFGNIYDRIHEEWMDDFQKEHNLPYPDPPEDDWYEKLKVEQRQLEEKWKKDANFNNYNNNINEYTQIKETLNSDSIKKYNERLIWIDIQIKKTNINFQNLNHLVKYKGSYRKAVTYFGNIYDRIHEEWMDDFQKEHNLPYPDPPEDDWYEKLKVEQRQLEEKWKKDANFNNYNNNINEYTQIKETLNSDSIKKYNERLIWIDIQIKKTNINFQNLNHLVKYKGSYRKAVTYFGNIYERIHEEWMDDFQKEHNLPYPDPPEDDWYEKLKVEQRQLEEKWHLGKKSTS